MIRCAVGPDGTAIISRTAPGRGAWLCTKDTPGCFTAAVKRRGFERAWRRPIGPGALSELRIAFESTPSHMREWKAAGSASDGPTPTKG
ncbi:MAG: YlxR family protein [Actinobacteria bacterium]|nr:YlxR family protein [Actinomycetota bacterium]